MNKTPQELRLIAALELLADMHVSVDELCTYEELLAANALRAVEDPANALRAVEDPANASAALSLAEAIDTRSFAMAEMAADIAMDRAADVASLAVELGWLKEGQK